MPLVHFFETSFGRVYSRRILLISVESEGVRGWGECVAGEDPFYSSEWIETAWPTITHYLAPALLQAEVRSGRDCPALFARVRGHRMAKGGLENAVWDAEARLKQEPLWKLLGGFAAGNCVWSFDWHSGLNRTTSAEDRDRIGGWLPANQDQGQAGMGPECSGKDSRALGRYSA